MQIFEPAHNKENRNKHSNDNSQQRQHVIRCVGPPLVDHATVLRMASIRIFIKLWQVSEYGNVACAFVCACSFSRTRVNKHMRHPTPTHAPHEKQEARTRMELTEKGDTARRSQKGTRDRCHCGFAFYGLTCHVHEYKCLHASRGVLQGGSSRLSRWSH